MGKLNRSKRPENRFAKGKVTARQVAFIVDRYLSDNNFSETRSVFRTEASSLISNSTINEAPKSLLTLVAMLNEYICLKEQKVILEQEKTRLNQEKLRVHAMLSGMQDVMNAYNASSASFPVVQSASVTGPAKSAAFDPQSVPCSGSPSGYVLHNAPTAMPVSMPPNSVAESGYLSPPVPNCPLTRKRAGSNVLSDTALPASKKFHSQVAPKSLPIKAKNTFFNQLSAQSSSAVELPSHNYAHNGSVKGCRVAKSLFNQPSRPNPNNSSGPKAPPQPVSSQVDKSPLGNSIVAKCSANNAPHEITPTNCTTISSERFMVSPYKQMTVFTMERNHCISSSSPVKGNLTRTRTRDHIKERLDFDGSDDAVTSDKSTDNDISTSDSAEEADMFHMDFPNLDALGPDFSFSELFVDLDLDCEGSGQPCQPPLGPSTDNVSGSSHESGMPM